MLHNSAHTDRYVTEIVFRMIVVVEQFLLDLHDLSIEVLVGVCPGSVQVLADQIAPVIGL